MKRLLLALWISYTFPIFYVFAEPIPADDIFVRPNVSSMGFSPNGKFVSMQIRNDRGSFIALMDTDSGVLKPIGMLQEDEELLDYNWLDSHTVLLKMRRSGRYSNVIMELAFGADGIVPSSKIIPHNGFFISTLPDDRNNVLFAKRGMDSRLLLYKTSIENLLSDRLEKSDRIRGLPNNASRYFYDENQKKLFAAIYDDESETVTLQFRNLMKGDWKPLIQYKPDDYSFTPIGFLNNLQLAVLTNKDSDKVALYEFDIETQTLGDVIYQHQNYDLNGANISSKTGDIISVNFYDHGKITFEFFTQKEQKNAKLIQAAFPQKQFVIVASSEQNGKYVIQTLASDSPGAFYLYHSTSKTAELIEYKYANMQQFDFAKSEVFTVSTNEQNIESYLTEPTQSARNVLLVMPHGGPIGIREDDQFNRVTQFFASRGFSILRVNFRGSKGFGKRFKDSGRGQFGQAIEKDISIVVEQVIEQKNYDKVCAMGSSYGGYSSMMLAIKHPEIYDCVVASYGIYDLPLLFNTSNIDVLEESREQVSKVVGTMEDSLFDNSPVYLADKINVPVLLIAGREDQVAHMEHTSRMHFMLKKFDKDVELLVYEKTGHGHKLWKGEMHQYSYIEDFLNTKLSLMPYDIESLSNNSKEGLANGFVKIADGFNFDWKVENDKSRAIQYYKKAAELGDAKSMYQIGKFYEEGTDVDKDIDAAIDWYKKSSLAGYGGASLILGQLYFRGFLLEQDYAQSISYFELAIEQKYNASAIAFAARAYCLGAGVEQNVKLCIDMMDIASLEKDPNNENPVTRASYYELQNALADIFIMGKYNDKQLEWLHQFVNVQFDVDVTPTEIQEKSAGQYLETKYNYFEFVEKAIIPSEFETRFGLRFNIKTDNIIASTGDESVVVGRWLMHSENGKTQIMDNVFRYGHRFNRTLIWVLNRQKEIGNAKWEIELYDLYGNKIYNKVFNLEKPTDLVKTQIH